ncbi:hypothetical protein MAHJHV50_49640 [Mycobacterium avium subsp. hominissuis]
MTASRRPNSCAASRPPEGFFGWEAAGLRWLSSVDGGLPPEEALGRPGVLLDEIGHPAGSGGDVGGVPCARVVAVDATSLTLRRRHA